MSYYFFQVLPVSHRVICRCHCLWRVCYNARSFFTILCSESSQPSFRSGRFVLLRLLIPPTHRAGLFLSIALLLLHLVFLISVFSVPLKLSILVNHSSVDVLELKSAAVCMDFIVSGVQPLSSSPVASFFHVVLSDIPSPPISHS